MDLAIQQRAGDLIIGTFGRGAYVLDDIQPLRALAADPAQALTYTCTPPGSGPRLAQDRDGDGIFDSDQRDAQSATGAQRSGHAASRSARRDAIAN